MYRLTRLPIALRNSTNPKARGSNFDFGYLDPPYDPHARVLRKGVGLRGGAGVQQAHVRER
ncbi:hypothetical protein Anae109_4008 [Anaeromyxobacter sp. Fw109-5]|nr:hypothetical protein Anae109_4008 [Anaeromyxobacter sp. Fw109-5]